MAEHPVSVAGGTVLHSYPVWLPRNHTWMHNQLKWLPDEWEAHVVCEATENLDRFPVRNLHVLKDAPVWRRTWDKLLRKAGLRRHVGYAQRVADRIGAGILHSHFGNFGWADLDLARAAGLRHVVTFYGADVHQLPRGEPIWQQRYLELFARVDRVLCEGPFMRQSLIDQGCPPDKAVVQHLGIDLDQIPFQPRTWTPGTPLKIFLSGGFREKKGIPDAIEAVGHLRRSRDLALQITIIGDAGSKAGDREEKTRILDALHRNDLSHCTRMLGFQSHRTLLDEAGRSHLFIHPSVTAADGDCEGGAPVTIIELAASGMPVVSTTHCDIPNVLIDGQSGLLAPEREPQVLGEKLCWLVDDPGSWVTLTTAARERIQEHFSARRQGLALGAIYAELLA